MQMGFAVPVAGSWATAANQRRIAERAEQLGYRRLWTFQRLLYPADPATPRWHESYRSVLDPLVTLGFLAGVTERVRLGVAVVNLPFYAPVLLAKQLATVDRLSNGRLDAGLGLGWSREEFEAVGVPYERRGARADEFLRCLEAIWSDEAVAFDGEFYRLPAAHVLPGPVQRPRPPLLLGGDAEPALQRAGRLADGWVSRSSTPPEAIARSIPVVQAAAAAAGRDPDRLQFVVRGSVHLRPEPDTRPDRPAFAGNVDQVAGDIAALSDVGVSEVFVDLNFDPEIGSPDADPRQSMQRAEAALEAFAPH